MFKKLRVTGGTVNGAGQAGVIRFEGQLKRSTLNAQRSTLNAQRSTLNAQLPTLNF
jgi:hypothetical protein